MNKQRLAETEIRARAYQLFRERGSLDGHALDDWLQAEYELMQLPIHKIAELKPVIHQRGQRRQMALVALVQAALVLGSTALPQLQG